MPVVSRTPAALSPLQRFRAWSERQLIEAAQEDLYRKYPGTATQPRRRGGLHGLVRFLFVTGFRFTPPRLRRALLQRMLVRKEQRWSSA